MKNLQEIFAAERLVKNLMWLERRNPLLSPRELLESGCKFSDRIREQLTQSGEEFLNEVLPMKTLEMMLRYLVHCELDVISSTMSAPKMEYCGRGESKMARTFTTLGRGNSRDLSLPMARGRAEDLGGGSISICTTA